MKHLNLLIIMSLPLALLATAHGPGLYTGQPGVNEYTGKPPGLNKPLARPYPQAPPFVSHEVGQFTISREQNDCVTCHGAGIGTRIPQSHYENDRFKDARYNCLLCHVRQTEARVPVGQKE